MVLQSEWEPTLLLQNIVQNVWWWFQTTLILFVISCYNVKIVWHAVRYCRSCGVEVFYADGLQWILNFFLFFSFLDFLKLEIIWKFVFLGMLKLCVRSNPKYKIKRDIWMDICIPGFLRQAAQSESIGNEKLILNENVLFLQTLGVCLGFFFIAPESQEPLWSSLLWEFHWNQTCREDPGVVSWPEVSETNSWASRCRTECIFFFLLTRGHVTILPHGLW